MPNPQKEETVEGLREMMAGSKWGILTDYRGLTVAEVTNLRKKLRDTKAEYHIVKNTLFKLALGGEVDPELQKMVNGATAILYGKEENVATSKAILDFTNAANKPDVQEKGPYLDGTVYNVDQVPSTSKLPPKPQIVAQQIDTLNSQV